MFEYKIEGGIPIRGTVKASGNKNSALPCIASSLLTDETVILRNIPDIEDTSVMISISEQVSKKLNITPGKSKQKKSKKLIFQVN